MTKTNIKKALSVFLSVLMVLSCWVWVAPEETHIHADAAVAEKGKVAFYVPEVIYLYPSLTSWKEATSTPFQYYIENTVNTSNIHSTPTPNTTLRSGGTIYFTADDGYEDVTITTRFTDASGNTISGGSVTVGSFSKSSNYGTFSVTAGTSPSLAASASGCYLEWTVHYTNLLGERQSAIAYTYIYKPYTVPYGTAARVENTDGWGATYHGFAQSLSWVSGVHSISGTGNRFANFRTTDAGGGLAAFLSDGAIGYNGSTALTGTMTQLGSADTFNSGARRMYAVFATTSSATAYFRANQANNGVSNAGVGGWVSESSSGSTYSTATFSYDNYSAGDNFIYMQIAAAAQGNIFIDTSRYTNLNQIPNLGVGLLVTDDENTDGSSGSWYVADATGQSNTGSVSTTDSGTGSTYYGNKGTVMAAQGSGYSANGSESEGIKYAGAWVRALSDTDSLSVTKTYKVKTFYGNGNDGEYQTEAGVMTLNATQQNKSTLRAVVKKAISKFATYGVTDNFGSYYYDTNSDIWNFLFLLTEQLLQAWSFLMKPAI